MASLVSSLLPCRMQVFCRLLADKFGVKVVQRGKQICADLAHKTIYLPAMEFPTEKSMRGLRGMALHEAAHIRWSTLETIKKTESLYERDLLNAIEDERIEVKSESVFPGARQMLVECHSDGLEYVKGEKETLPQESYLGEKNTDRIEKDSLAHMTKIFRALGEEEKPAKAKAEKIVEEIKAKGGFEAAAKRMEFDRASLCWLYEKRGFGTFIPIPKDWATHPWKPIFDRATAKRAKNTEEALVQARQIIKEVGMENLVEEDGWHSLQKKALEAAKAAADASKNYHEAERDAKTAAKEKADATSTGKLKNELEEKIEKEKNKLREAKYAKENASQAQNNVDQLEEDFKNAVRDVSEASSKDAERQKEAKEAAKEAEEAERRLIEAQKKLEKVEAAVKEGKATGSELKEAQKEVRDARQNAKDMKQFAQEAAETAKALEKAKRHRDYLKDKLGEAKRDLEQKKDRAEQLDKEAKDVSKELKETKKEYKEVKKNYDEIYEHELNKERKEKKCEELKEKAEQAGNESRKARNAAEEVQGALDEYEKAMIVAGFIEVIEKAWESFRNQTLEECIAGDESSNGKDNVEKILRPGDPTFDGPARNYCVYDRQFDSVDEIVSDSSTDAEAIEAREVYGPMVPPMVAALKQLRPPVNPVVKVNVERGRPNTKMLYKLGVATRGACNVDVRRIWKTTHDVPAPKLAVSILVDCSGSMHGSRHRQACMTAMAMHETLKTLNIPHEILGHTTQDPLGGIVIPNGVDIRDFSRFAPFHGLIFKRFDQSTPPNGLFGANSLFGMESNVDGEAVSWAAIRLMERPEKFKLLISVCDGLPMCHASITGELQRHLRTVCRKLESLQSQNFYLFGIGIELETIKYYYRHNQVLEKIEDLPNLCFRIIESVLGKSVGVKTKYAAEMEKKEVEEEAELAAEVAKKEARKAKSKAKETATV